MANQQIKLRLSKSDDTFLRDQARQMGITPSALCNIILSRANHTHEAHRFNKCLEASASLAYDGTKAPDDGETVFTSLRVDADAFSAFQGQCAAELAISGNDALILLVRAMHVIGLGKLLQIPVQG